MSKIRLYGRIQGGGDSWARVTYGIKGALEELGLLAGFCPVHDEVADLDEGLTEGYDAPVAVYIGPPAHCSVMRGRGEHEHRLALIAANSSWLPAATMSTIGEFVTGILGPSRWSCDVIRRHAPDVPVYRWRHGVSEVFRPATWKPEAALRVGHLASGVKERKGTEELIRAWDLLATRGGKAVQRLELVVDGQWQKWEELAKSLGREGEIFATSRRNMTEEEARAFYQSHHVIAQPSRGEGFGMVPLEALCSGVPVIATACTGHEEFLGEGLPGAIIVPHGPDGPIDDGPDAKAPTVRPADIADALERASGSDVALLAWLNASNLAREWSWRAVTELFLREHGAELGLGGAAC